LVEAHRQRGAIDWEFGRLKHSFGVPALRVPRLERVRLHADQTILARSRWRSTTPEKRSRLTIGALLPRPDRSLSAHEH
jgi:hypothetical protein